MYSDTAQVRRHPQPNIAHDPRRALQCLHLFCHNQPTANFEAEMLLAVLQVKKIPTGGGGNTCHCHPTFLHCSSPPVPIEKKRKRGLGREEVCRSTVAYSSHSQSL